MLSLEERLEHLEALIDELVVVNREIPAIVEGKRDVRALRRLGLEGEILMVNTGESRITFCDRLAGRYAEAILLTDWDRTGGIIARDLRDNLKGRVRLERNLRKGLALYSEVSAVEELPGYMGGLVRRIRGEAERTRALSDEE